MFKLTGMIMIICAGTGLGATWSQALVRQERTLVEIQKMVGILKGEIRYGCASLYDSLTETAEKMRGEYRAFLLYTAKNMKESRGRTFGEIFEETAEELCRKTGLTGVEKEAFCALGNRLGYLDLQMQLGQLSLYEEELERELQKIRRDYPAKKKVYRSLGILGGIFLAVLVM